MFTGIVEEIGRITRIQSGKLTIGAQKVLGGVGLGDSIAVNGVCLTVTDFTGEAFTVDIMPETIRRSNIALLKAGDAVNLERALALGGRIGGHLVQGHSDGTGKVIALQPEGEAVLVRFSAPREVMRYVVGKGFIAVDGVSLTVVTRDERSFTVSLVGFTRRHTTLGNKRVGEAVNLEVDIIAKYVEVLTGAATKGVTEDFLKEHGFVVS